MVSIVIPVFNEVASITTLFEELHWACAYLEDESHTAQQRISTIPHNSSSFRGGEHGGRNVEFIFVDDGSTDGSWEAMASIADRDARVSAIRMRRNCGKSAAYSAGFAHARGEIIATIDADLQDDPREISSLLDMLENPGHDLVSGWKRARQDTPLKIVSSRLFNAACNMASGTRLHDQNCGLRVMRRSVVDAVSLHGDLYRMIPALAAMQGFRVGEVAVNHRPRRFGESKYGRTGLRRTFRGLFDLATVAFLHRFRARPLHFFGAVGLVLLGVGIAMNGYLSVLWLRGASIGSRPLLLLGILLMVLGVQFVSTGFLADLMISGSKHEEEVPVAEIR
jgi:glycosyltransferase involved in cell wall biosynthesis